MANIKEVHIQATVPFNLFDSDVMPAEDAAFVARLLLAPSMGLQYRWEFRALVQNENGGQTSMYTLAIEGREALRFESIKRLVGVFRKVGGILHEARARDIEDPASGEWVHFPVFA